MKPKSFTTIILLTILLSLTLATHASSVEQMRGFYWMTALPQRFTTSETAFERYLQRMETVLQTNTYIEGAHLIVPWEKLEAAAEDYRFDRLDRVIETLAERYSSDFNLVAVSCVGANFMSCELHLPRTTQRYGAMEKSS